MKKNKYVCVSLEFIPGRLSNTRPIATLSSTHHHKTDNNSAHFTNHIFPPLFNKEKNNLRRCWACSTESHNHFTIPILAPI